MKSQLSLLAPEPHQDVESPFDRWIATRANSTSIDTQNAHKWIWQSFSRFLLKAGLSVDEVDEDDLELFLAGISPRQGAGEAVNPRYAWRALDLINKVLQHEARDQDQSPNMAAATLLNSERFRYANARNREPLPEISSPRAACELVQKLASSAESLGLKSNWKLERDRTCVALMLGSGLTPIELRSLTLDNLYFSTQRNKQVPWKIRVPATGSVVEHEAPIANWARRSLRDWLIVREKLNLPSTQLFPATSTRSEWTDVGCQRSCTQMLLTLMGDEYRYGGLMRLRHTFVVRQLARGTELETVADWLGIRDMERLAGYRRIIPRDEFVA